MSFQYLFESKTSQLIADLQTIPLEKAILKLQNNPDKLQIINQLDGIKRTKTKLPTWFDMPKIVYPPKINLEQCSSEIAAKYKSVICEGKHLIDLTGGFGVDSFYFSKYYESVTYIEKNNNLFEIANWNFLQLKIKNIETLNTDCEQYLENFKRKYKKEEIVFFIDPARRSESNKKLVQFADCEPNIIALIPKLFEFSETIIVKASPMHDINLALNELKFVDKVHVLSVKNECKELLFILKNSINKNPEICTINIDYIIQKYNFNYIDINYYNTEYYDVKKYILETNSSVMKSGAFKVILQSFSIQKIAPNTHLYTSDEIIKNFPGKIFEIESEIKLTSKEIAVYIPDNQINIISRNYILTADEIKQKLKLKDGGKKFLICFKDQFNIPKSYICSKIII
ncbi:MAG: class I SAM-dependent methyltransferase [Bacteroidetes bacterium]|nr:MAG: class I SAM-dependent methyltransferase [Bacteroidota bacterium]